MAKDASSGTATKILVGAAVLGVAYELWVFFRGNAAAAQGSLVGGSSAGGYNPYNPYGAYGSPAATAAQSGSINNLNPLLRLLSGILAKTTGAQGPGFSLSPGNGGSGLPIGMPSGGTESLAQIAASIGGYNTNAINMPIPQLGGQSLATYTPYNTGPANAGIPYDPLTGLNLSGFNLPGDPLAGLGGYSSTPIDTTSNTSPADAGISYMDTSSFPLQGFSFSGIVGG